MSAHRPSQVRNMITSSLIEIVDPSPSEKGIDRIWEFFDSECAYCGVKLNRSRREGHIDHLVPKSVYGSNHITNRVLSCGICNGDEKRDAHWIEFISAKCAADQTLMKKRIDKIKEWQDLNKGQALSPKMRSEISSLSDRVCMYYDRAVKKARELRNLNESKIGQG